MTATHHDSDDAALLRAHAAGDPDAFGELVRRHRDRLWAVALRTLGDREEAADAVQDALLSAYRAADRFRGDSAVTTWLHRIVVNACLDRLRRRQSRPTVPLPDYEIDLSSSGANVGQLGVAPVHDSDTALTVQAALARLPAEQRVALVLLDMQGYAVAEIASMLGIAEGTVKSRCARGRAKLAVLLGHLRPEPTSDRSLPRGVPGNRPRPDGVGSAEPEPSAGSGPGTDHVGQGGVR